MSEPAVERIAAALHGYFYDNRVHAADCAAGGSRDRTLAGYVLMVDPTIAADLNDAARLREAAELGLAWVTAEAALPDDWELELSVGRHGSRDLYTATASYCYSLRHYRENVGPSRSTPFEMAHGPTPAAALRDLAVALAVYREADHSDWPSLGAHGDTDGPNWHVAPDGEPT